VYHLVTNKTGILIRAKKEIILSKDETTTSRTDIDGNILYYNSTFAKISGYKKSELLYAPHSILRHPDMPKAIFYIIWQTLLSGRSTHAIIKNFTKDGNYYWLGIEFIVQKDNQNNIVSFLSHGKQASQYAIDTIEPIYKNLLKIEKEHNMEKSIKHLSSFLNNNNYATYNDYICRILKERKRGFFSNLIF